MRELVWDLSKIRRLEFGDAPTPVLVADDALRNLDELRDSARGWNFVGKRSFNLGLSSVETLDAQAFGRAVADLIPEAAGWRWLPWELLRYTERYDAANAKLNIPHVDPQLGLIALLYLTPDVPDRPSGGTAFYRHGRLGLDYLPSVPDERVRQLCEHYGLDDFHSVYRLLQTAVLSETGAPTREQAAVTVGELARQWDRLDLVELRCNRLLIYDPKRFHAAVYGTSDFGEDFDGCRLVLRTAAFGPGSGIDDAAWRLPRTEVTTS